MPRLLQSTLLPGVDTASTAAASAEHVDATAIATSLPRRRSAHSSCFTADDAVATAAPALHFPRGVRSNVLARDFLAPSAAVKLRDEGPSTPASASSSFLSTPAVPESVGELGGQALPPHGELAKDVPLAQSGMHMHLESTLHSLRTALMMTGGMCNKLFGLGMIGVLSFQSARANMNSVSTPPPPKQPELVSQRSLRASSPPGEDD
mmetsp:Transcript_28544/g.66147  ORF Transcript_28544/g.66147 Transcript_28544/m.66147 type:complete len:207 (+) Transcript_28544:70-690(+)